MKILVKGITETVENEVKEQKGGFLSALLGTLGASLLEDLLIGKGAIGRVKDKEYIELEKEKEF